MDLQQVHDDVAMLASSARTNEHCAIAQRIVQLQTRITSNRRRLERLHAHASQQDDGAERLRNALAQYEFEMQYWVARLELLQPVP